MQCITQHGAFEPRVYLYEMPRMRMTVEQVMAEGLRVELPGQDGAIDVLAITSTKELRGEIESDAGLVSLDGLRASVLEVAELSWGTPWGRVQGKVMLGDVEIDATLRPGAHGGDRPFVGALRARVAHAKLECVGPGLDVQARLTLGGFALRVGDD